ncbi:MAG: PfkB family carbohydrate kinase [Planctomycetia bacterium]|nr:PfkB family carbohydrate kinase [Planctomycetia bacterium]
MRQDYRVQVFGPAYLDRVVLVDGPLSAPGCHSLDQSVDGTLTFGPGLVFGDPTGVTLSVAPPPGWPGPTGLVNLSGPLGGCDRAVVGLAWHDDLGGMGAGFAAALRGDLVSALGPEDDPMSRAVATLLGQSGVRHRPIRVESRPADWTLLVTSGPFGDKLPVGFRGCHAAIESLEGAVREAGGCDLRVVASLPNRLAAQVLRDPSARVRVFAPSSRNMTDREVPVRRFAEWVDILCCNRREWECLEDREQVAWQVAILAVTDGPAGSVVRFTTPDGEAGRIEVPAFPRSRPPADTNRAGEAYASTLVSTLLDAGWSNGVADPALVRLAAGRASAAAALVIDRHRFGFPTVSEVDAAMLAGRIAGPVGGGGGDPRYNAGDGADPGEPGGSRS